MNSLAADDSFNSLAAVIVTLELNTGPRTFFVS